MKVKNLNCPTCGAPLPTDIKPNKQFSCVSCSSALVLTDLATDDQVVCNQCGTVNSDSRQFCTDCGSSLKMPCPFCYASNTTDDEFCRNCGANLLHARQRKHSWLNKQRKHKAAQKEALEQAEAQSRKAKLEKLLEDLDEPENHPMAIYQLHQFGEEAVESLIDLLKDEDPDARFGAAQTLGLIGDPKAIPGLVDALTDPDPSVRYWATDALGKLRATSAVKAIGNLLDDKHKGVKQHAVETLELIGGPEAALILQKYNKRKRKWVLF